MTDKTTTYLCPQCQIGHLQAGKMTYVRVMDGMMMSVPDTLAYTCDVCGYQEFDRDTVAHIDTLVGDGRRAAGTGRPTTRAHRIDGKSTRP